VFHDGDSIIGTAERIALQHRRIILLTDWDRTGGTIHARMRETLTTLGVRCDERLRKELAVLVSKETRSLEGVPGFLERLRVHVGRPT
jgi:5S rRNA maturation endonuclease (ribonuclease M5)